MYSEAGRRANDGERQTDGGRGAATYTSTMAEWFADESLWEAIYPFEFPDAVIAAGATQVASALRLRGVPQAGRALDLGCGPGRHAIALASRGFTVTAVDLSAFHLAKAKEHVATAGLVIELLRADMRAFVRPDSFDLALSLFTSFGYFDAAEDDLRVLQNVHQSLRPGGALVMDMVSKECLARNFDATTSHKVPDGSLLFQRHAIRDDWTRVSNEWTVVTGTQARTFDFSLRVYSGRELRDLLVRAGFASVDLYGGLDGRRYGLEAERLVAVASKHGRDAD